MGLSGLGESPPMVPPFSIRLIEPTRGQVLIDGVDIAKMMGLSGLGESPPMVPPFSIRLIEPTRGQVLIDGV
ncbi:hypothetical protein CQA09_29495, partial [Klebsiella pneumoniae]